ARAQRLIEQVEYGRIIVLRFDADAFRPIIIGKRQLEGEFAQRTGGLGSEVRVTELLHAPSRADHQAQLIRRKRESADGAITARPLTRRRFEPERLAELEHREIEVSRLDAIEAHALEI